MTTIQKSSKDNKVS